MHISVSAASALRDAPADGAVSSRQRGPVVVGIDGSHAAIHAALWAVDEAESRGVPLRLVCVVDPATSKDDSLERRYAENALRSARAAIDETGKSVTVDTAITPGAPESVLIEESRTAEMVCVGSVGIGRFARLLLGCTVAALAKAAHCPLAVIRNDDASRSMSGYVAVGLDDSAHGRQLMQVALNEARLRRAPLLAIAVEDTGHASTNHDLSDWRQRYPDVRIDLVTARNGVPDYLAHDQPNVQLVVLGEPDGKRVEQLVGPVGNGHYPHAESSVLVMRR